jgi:hypothetical protein
MDAGLGAFGRDADGRGQDFVASGDVLAVLAMAIPLALALLLDADVAALHVSSP